MEKADAVRRLFSIFGGKNGTGTGNVRNVCDLRIAGNGRDAV